jgi:outer membrane protein insertion porin family
MPAKPISRYVTDTFGEVRYGIPPASLIYPVARAYQVDVTSSSPPVSGLLNENGDEYTVLKLTGGWSHDTRNRALLPDRGMLTTCPATSQCRWGSSVLQGELPEPWLQPLTKSLTLSLNSSVAYGGHH